MEEDNNKLKIICQRCNIFATRKGRSGELLYITFLHDGFSTLGLYPKDLDSYIFYFKWTARTKIQRMHKKFLKEVNGDHNYLRYTYIRYNNFEVLHSAIALDKIDLGCVTY